MTAYNAYRVQKVLNYDSNSQKGFVTERSKEEYSRCVREMKACMKEIDAQFGQIRLFLPLRALLLPP